MSREINLLNYLPHEIRKYKDYQVITESENPEFKILFEISQQILDESFIESASEYGVSKFEHMLKLYPGVNDSLEIRKTKLLIWWNNQVPYTWRVLIEKLNAICGVGKYKLELYPNEYRIEIDSQLNLPSQYEDLRFLLDTILPCNLVIISTNTLKRESIRELFYGSLVTELKKIVIDNNLNIKDSVNEIIGYNSRVTELKSIKIGSDTNTINNYNTIVNYNHIISDYKSIKIESEGLI